jgi:hypothetical protein
MEAVAPIIMEVRETARKEIAAARNEIAQVKAELEAVKALRPEKGDPGEPGKDADPVDVDAVVAKLLPLMPVPKDGESVTVDDVMPAILQAVAEKAVPGAPGKDADPVDVDAVVSKLLEQMPKPKDGQPGKDAEVDLDALALKASELIPVPKNGKDGKDAIDVVDLLIDREGALVATFSNGTIKTLGHVVGKDADVSGLERLIQDRIAEIPSPEMDKAAVEKFVADELDRIAAKSADEYAPDDVASNIALAVKMMAEMPNTKQQSELQPINVYSDVRMPDMSFPAPVVNLTVPEQAAPVVNLAAPVVNVAAPNIELPKKGKEVTTVTSWDKDGRIKTFEKQEVEPE